MANIRILQDVSLYNNINVLSGINTTTLNVTNSASLNKLSINGQVPDGYSLAVGGDAYISGNLTIAGSAKFNNATYTTTSALSVTDTGTGPALVVLQTGEQPVAAFYDDSNISLYIDGKTGTAGYVGVGTSLPNQKLTVIGSISATGTIYGGNTVNKFVSAFGDTTNTSFTLNHNLGVSDVVVSIIDATTKEVVYPLVTNTALNQITVSFSQAPGLAAYKAIVIG